MIAGVVLAAGLSSRMGRLKATLPLPGGDTFVTRVVRTLLAGGAHEVVTVLGHQAESVREVLERSGLPTRVAINAAYHDGQLSSLLVGLDALNRDDVEAMLLMLVDVPLVSVRTVSTVLERYRVTHAPIVRPVSGSRHGHPVLIARSLFSLLRAADPREGAKPIVRAHVSPAGDVEVDDEGAFFDVDVPEDLNRLPSGP
jgi:CTP:molybdopterin cytidylyltransferase MocA